MEMALSDADTVPYVLDRVIHNEAFQVGEKLTFVVRYGIIKAGEATMEVEGIVPIADREAFKVVSKAKSARAFDLFFKVRDQVESWVDTQGIFSWKFNKLLREGGFKFDLIVDYDQLYGKAIVQNQVGIDDKSNEIPALPELLAPLELDGTVVTADALNTQRESARHIVQDKGGHYVFTVKDNQQNLRKRIEQRLSGRTFSLGPPHR